MQSGALGPLPGAQSVRMLPALYSHGGSGGVRISAVSVSLVKPQSHNTHLSGTQRLSELGNLNSRIPNVWPPVPLTGNRHLSRAKD